MGLLRSQHLGIETRETNGKYSSQIQNGWLHKVRRKGKNRVGAGRIGDAKGFPDRVARLSPSLSKPDCFYFPGYLSLYISLSQYI